MTADTPPGVEVRDLLNAQTGRIEWPELQRPFARGLVLVVDPFLDLVEVAARVVQDDRAAIQSWTDAGRLSRADLDHARAWAARQTPLWAVVVAPWVLVQQDRRDEDGQPPA